MRRRQDPRSAFGKVLRTAGIAVRRRDRTERVRAGLLRLRAGRAGRCGRGGGLSREDALVLAEQTMLGTARC